MIWAASSVHWRVLDALRTPAYDFRCRASHFSGQAGDGDLSKQQNQAR